MKKVLFGLVLMIGLGSILAFTTANTNEKEPATEAAEEITWYTWDEALALSAKEPRKMFIDVYTDWCGWCKRMDATTFKDPKVVEHINANYYAVKFDAEQKEEIEYNDHTFKFIPSGRRGVHELAYALLDGQLSYPSYVYLDNQQRRLYISKGYKQVEQMMTELNYFTDEKYLDQ
jgi:thioredoxin-related protein